MQLGWRASGYFIGEHAVLVRRIGGGTSATAAAKQLNAKAKAAQDFARDLVSDLDDDDDDDEEEEEEEEGGSHAGTYNPPSPSAAADETREASCWGLLLPPGGL